MAVLVAPNREQLKAIAGNDFDLLKKLEDLFGIVAAQPVQPITVAIDADTTYTVTNEVGTQTILIPEAMLVASAGGPFTLTLTTGSGSVVEVPIAAFGDVISSGDLLFDIFIDASGNALSKAWSISGSNSNGAYELRSTGEMEARLNLSNGAAVQNWVYPRAFIAAPITEFSAVSSGAVFISAFSNTATNIDTSGWDAAGAANTSNRRGFASGRWRA